MRICTIRPIKGTNIRSSRWIVCATTIDRIRSTAIKEWLFWFPENVITTMSYGNQIIGTIKDIKLDDGTVIDAEILFTSADDIVSAGKFRSQNITGAWMVEVSEFKDDSVYKMLIGRCGRWPAIPDGGASWRGLMGDTNSMRDDHWYAVLENSIRPEDVEFFTQPPALLDAFPFDPKNPQYIPNEGQDERFGPAENISHLQGATEDNPRGGFSYYLGLAAKYQREWIKVFIQNQLGQLVSKRPVYAQWRDDEHAARGLVPWRGIPIRLGFDWGLTPSCVISQLNKNGTWCALEEVTSSEIGARQFARMYLAPVLMKRYYGLPIIAAGDPAGLQRDQSNESNCFKELAAIGITINPAPSQNIVSRHEAVAEYLDRKGCFRVDIDRCPTLHKGFKGDYYLDDNGNPCKDHPVSDIHNALEYIMHYTSVNPTDSAASWNGDAIFGAEAFAKMGFRQGSGTYRHNGVLVDGYGNPIGEHSEVAPNMQPKCPESVDQGESVGHWM